MASRLYNGSVWKNINALRLWNGSAWKNATKGWVWNGSSWRQWYPEYPVNTVAPTISGSATQGNTLTATTGTWNSNAAYGPTSYSYQWRRGTSDISGATSSTYATVLADVGNAISCRVTANNNRGPTPVISSNSITITSAIPGPPSNLTITSSTTTPGTFTVSGSSSSATPTITMGSNTGVTSTAGTINWSSTNQSSWSSNGTFSGSGTTQTSVSKTGLTASTSYTGTVTITGPGSTTASGSWTSATNTSSYSISTSAATLSSDTNARTWSLSSGTTGGSYTITVTATNTSGSAFLSWSAGSNATSYDIYINGALWQTGYNGTSVTYNWGTTGTLTVNVRSRNAAGAETTGVTNTGTVSSASRQASTSGTFASAQTASANYSLTTTAPPNLTAPTITSVPNINEGGTLSVSFSGGSGPWYQIAWAGSAASFATQSFYDGVGSSSPVTATGPSVAGTYWAGVRSSSTQTGTGLGPSTSFSDWVTQSFTVNQAAPSSAPSGGTATRYTAGTCNYTSVSWNSLTGATSYETFRTTSSTTTPTAATTPTATNITSTSWDFASSALAYYFVRARNAAGPGPWSARITPGTSAAAC